MERILKTVCPTSYFQIQICSDFVKALYSASDRTTKTSPLEVLGFIEYVPPYHSTGECLFFHFDKAMSLLL